MVELVNILCEEAQLFFAGLEIIADDVTWENELLSLEL